MSHEWKGKRCRVTGPMAPVPSGPAPSQVQAEGRQSTGPAGPLGLGENLGRWCWIGQGWREKRGLGDGSGVFGFWLIRLSAAGENGSFVAGEDGPYRGWWLLHPRPQKKLRIKSFKWTRFGEGFPGHGSPTRLGLSSEGKVRTQLATHFLGRSPGPNEVDNLLSNCGWIRRSASLHRRLLSP